MNRARTLVARQYDLTNLDYAEYIGGSMLADNRTIADAIAHDLPAAISGDLIARLRALGADTLPEFPNFTNCTTIDARNVTFRTRRH